jgi:hypothetical protein
VAVRFRKNGNKMTFSGFLCWKTVRRFNAGNLAKRDDWSFRRERREWLSQRRLSRQLFDLLRCPVSKNNRFTFGGKIRFTDPPGRRSSRRQLLQQLHLPKTKLLKLFHGHDSVMRSAEKTFITEALFIDWLHTQFIQRNRQLSVKAHCDGPIVLLSTEMPVTLFLTSSPLQVPNESFLSGSWHIRPASGSLWISVSSLVCGKPR